MQDPDAQLPADPNSEQAIIDRFLALAPTLTRIRPEEQVAITTTSSEDNEPEDTELDASSSEALGKALATAGKRKEAAAIFLKLAVQMPEKSAYFADLLDNRASGPDIF
jgi:hypothetical protein